MGKIIKRTILALVALFALIQLYRPTQPDYPTDQSQTIQARTQMTPVVSAILARSCYDCHSYQTTYPWYHKIAPVSWFLNNHINSGRQHLNFSTWGQYNPQREAKKLEGICEEVTSGDMPLSSYLLLHPTAKLSAQDKQTLCDWTKAEQQRLAGSTIGK